MNLAFKTTINGKPTNFVEKIWEGFLQRGISFKAKEMQIGMKALPEEYKIKTFNPKLHTIRKDENSRWKAGIMIDFFINPRQKNMFRFAPRVPVVSTQLIVIIYNEDQRNVFVDGIKLCDKKIEDLAVNDGFENQIKFFEYFFEDFTGQIIHWTDLQY